MFRSAGEVPAVLSNKGWKDEEDSMWAMKGLFFFKKSISVTPRATFKFKFDFNLLFDMVPAVWGLVKRH